MYEIEMSAAEMIAEHTGRIEWAGFASSDVELRSALLEAATRRRESVS